jgi:two-component system sensor histidine kinase/response regulator
MRTFIKTCLDAFAHTVAHNLKNPVGLVIGYADLLVQDYAMLSPTELYGFVQHIWHASQQLDRIIEELLLLAGVRKQTVTPEPLAMAEIVQEVCARLQMLVQDTQAQISVSEVAAWPTALGYAPWIAEVWINYLSNALKYGGQPPRVEVGWVRLRNRDKRS